MLHQLLLIATLLPAALSITTLQAILAPTNAAASVLTIADGATTYVLQCTTGCPTNNEKAQATLVNGASTAGLTLIGADGKTLIRDCTLASDKMGACTTRAISAGETRTDIKESLTFKEVPVVITAGLDKLGYVVVETTMEVNTTVTQRGTSKTASSTASVTLTGSTGSGKITGTSATATKTAATTDTTGLSSAAGPGVLQGPGTSTGAAPTMKAGIMGGAIAGLAGLLMVAL